MRWIKTIAYGLLDAILRLVFGKNSKLGNRYGLSFDNNVSINSLPSPMPNKHDFYEVVSEKIIYEVLDISVEDNLVYIRETGTDTIYPINAELFIMLFVKKEQVKVDFS